MTVFQRSSRDCSATSYCRASAKIFGLRLPAICAVFCFIIMFQASAEETGQPVRVADVISQPVSRTVSTYGVLAPKVEDLSFRINGRIAHFKVSEGQTVEAGQVLAELEQRDARDTLDKAKLERQQAVRKLERFEKLAKQSLIDASQLEEARDLLEKNTIAYNQAALALERCTLTAPTRGVILKEYVESRTTIVAGTPIYAFRDVSKSWLTEVELTDQNAFAFGLGTRAVARFSPYPGEEFAGELTKQAGIADENDGLYTVEITIVTNGREFRPGMVVEIDLSHETDASYSMVPLDAVVDLRSTQGVIYLLDEAGLRVEEKTVHIMAITGNSVALVEPIAAGRKVVVRGQQSLRDKTPVRVL
jgi:RND family efflux transporter MFP subunit